MIKLLSMTEDARARVGIDVEHGTSSRRMTSTLISPVVPTTLAHETTEALEHVPPASTGLVSTMSAF